MSTEKKALLLEITFTLIWILVLIYAALRICPSVPTWPMFFIGIFSSVYKGQKTIQHIILQAVIGVLAALALYVLEGKLTQIMGAAGVWIPLGLILAMLLYGCVFFPKLFSMINFAYFSIATIEMGLMAKPFPILAMLIIGGTVQFLGDTGAKYFIEKLYKK